MTGAGEGLEPPRTFGYGWLLDTCEEASYEVPLESEEDCNRYRRMEQERGEYRGTAKCSRERPESDGHRKCGWIASTNHGEGNDEVVPAPDEEKDRQSGERRSG